MSGDDWTLLPLPWAVVAAGGLVAAAMLGQVLLTAALRDRYVVVVAGDDIRLVDTQGGKYYTPRWAGPHPASSR